MDLDVASQLASAVLQLPAGRVERVAQGDIDVGVLGAIVMVMTDDDRGAARRGDFDMNLELVTLTRMMRRLIDDHVDADDPIVDLLEILDSRVNLGLDRWR